MALIGVDDAVVQELRFSVGDLLVVATRKDWKTTPLPKARASITLDRTYSAAEFQRICEGYIPQEMEDKWFSYYEEPWLYLHRSWTGFGIYQVRFEPTAEGGGEVVEVLVSRDPEQYKETDNAVDSRWVAFLLDEYAGRETDGFWE